MIFLVVNHKQDKIFKKKTLEERKYSLMDQKDKDTIPILETEQNIEKTLHYPNLFSLSLLNSSILNVRTN